MKLQAVGNCNFLASASGFGWREGHNGTIGALVNGRMGAGAGSGRGKPLRGGEEDYAGKPRTGAQGAPAASLTGEIAKGLRAPLTQALTGCMSCAGSLSAKGPKMTTHENAPPLNEGATH